jgi:multidrug efflux pump subunit AcrB
MRNAIASITRLAVRFRWITMTLTLMLIAAGVYSFMQFNQELLPDIEFPNTLVVAQNGGATSENMLHMYTVPLERELNDVSGVVNVQTTTNDGLMFSIISNEFGLVQNNVTDDIDAVTDNIEQQYVPIRRLTPPDGVSVEDMFAELSAEHILWLENYANQRNEGFKQQLLPEIWLSLSAETLQGIPESSFDLLGASLQEELLAKRDTASGTAQAEDFAFDQAAPPRLPASWQQSDDRFRTAADLSELATTRSVAAVLNNFYENGTIAGPLGDTSDIRPENIEQFLLVESNCLEFFNGNPPMVDGVSRCSFVRHITTVNQFQPEDTALLAINNLTPEAYAALPEDLRNAYELTTPLEPITENGETFLPTGVPLPMAWRVEALQLQTFSFSDVPLASLSVSSADRSSDELRRLIEDNLVPTLRERENIAQVTVVGGSLSNNEDNGGLPEEPVTRTNGDSSLTVTIFKTDEANTVVTWDDTNAFLDEWSAENNVEISVAFEQATFIEESISGVTSDGLLGAVMAIVVILIFMNLSVRSTLVTSVSIPTSVMTALVLAAIVPANVNDILAPILEDVGRDTTFGSILEVIVRLFPASFTLNIMTLSGLTVAIGRVVDDSIVVLENIYRNVQQGGDQKEAVLNGTREVSVAILAATATTMLVFLPLGLFGGVTGAFFLPFGLAVTYSLVGSYMVAITTVPALSSLLITRSSMIESVRPVKDNMNTAEASVTRVRNVFIGSIDKLSNAYGRLISFLLKNTVNRLGVIAAAFATLIFGLWLLGQRPQTFLPNFGEAQATIEINLPPQLGQEPTSIEQTNAIAREIETYLLGGDYENPFTGETVSYEGQENEGVSTVTASVGGDAQQFDSATSSISPNVATVRVGIESQEQLDAFLPDLREFSEQLMAEAFPEVPAAPDFISVSSGDGGGGGFGGFAIEIRGENEDITLDDLRAYDSVVLQTLEEVDGLVNIESSNSGLGGGENTYIRIDGEPAIRYTAEIEADDTLGITNTALMEAQDAVAEFEESNPQAAPALVSQGFDSEQQQEGFQQIFISMGIATVIVYVILALTFGNLIHPITILVSLPLAIVGAAIGLTVTGRVLGLSSLIGLLMLIGIVVTNAVVFLDRVQQNRREKNMSTYDALVEAGTVRLRPIMMTAISTTMGVFPLALGLTEGAIIAAELGTVVIGGLASSTVLTLIVLPVVYSLFDDITGGLMGLFTGNKKEDQAKSTAPSPAGD